MYGYIGVGAMTTRAERDLLLSKQQRRRKVLKYASVSILTLLVLVGVIDQLSRTLFSPVSLLSSSHTCKIDGCEYLLIVKNSGYATLEGFATISVFKRFNLGDVESNELLAKERLLFTLASGEEHEIKGLIKTPIKPSSFIVNVGEARR